jgi:Domain of unknown function (DUF4260)
MKVLLALEGAAIGIAAISAYWMLSGPALLFALLILAPDIAMLGYFAGPRAGSVIYNAVHHLALPVLALCAGWIFAAPPLLMHVLLIWIAHIGMDRAVGYGLKYPTAFKETHMQRV